MKPDPSKQLETLLTQTNIAQYSRRSEDYQQRYIEQVARLLQTNSPQAAKIVLACLTENNESFEKIKRHYLKVVKDYHNDQQKIKELSHQITSLSSLRDSNQSLTDRMTRTWKENQALQRRNIQLEKQRASLNNEIGLIKDDLQSARDLQKRHATIHAKQQNQLNDLRAANAKYKKDKRKLNKKITKTLTQLKSTEQQIQQLLTENAPQKALIDQLTSFKNAVGNLKSQEIQQLKEEIQQLKQEVRILQATMKQMSTEVLNTIPRRLNSTTNTASRPRVIHLEGQPSIFAPNIIGNGRSASLPSLTTMIRRLNERRIQVFVKGFFIHHPENGCHDIDLIFHCDDNKRELVQEVNEIMNETPAFCGWSLSNYEYSQAFMIDRIPVDISVSKRSLEVIMQTTRTVMSASGLRQLTVKGDQIIMHPSLLFCNAQELPIIQNAIVQNKLCLFKDYTKQLQELIQSDSDIMIKRKTLCFLAKMFSRHTTTSPKSWQLMTALMTDCQPLDIFFITYLKSYLEMFQCNLQRKLMSIQSNYALWFSAYQHSFQPAGTVSLHACRSAEYQSTQSTQTQPSGSSYQHPPLKPDATSYTPH